MKTIKYILATTILCGLFFTFTHAGRTIEVANAQSTQKPMKEQVMDILRVNGVDTILAGKIIQCESNWNPNVVNHNKNGSTDWGIFQLNSIHGWSIADMQDPITSTYLAIKLIKSSRGWANWVCLKYIK